MLEQVTASARFATPPRTLTHSGRERRVGIEIEFAGLSIPEAAALVARTLGGRTEDVERFSAKVVGTRLGEFVVEADSRPFKERRYLEFLQHVGADAKMVDRIEDGLEWFQSHLIPCEIVTPPVPLGKLEMLEELRLALYVARAEGTGASLFYAFGLHINAEVPDLTPATLLAHLRAFLLLEDWLEKDGRIDPIRRLTPYIRPFPLEYRRLVLDERYQPDIDALIDDYLDSNPTRNRPLDLLPLFATIRPERVMAATDDPGIIKPRPTFHYRLPNCRIDEREWTLAEEWNRWVEVERLAADTERIAGLLMLGRR